MVIGDEEKEIFTAGAQPVDPIETGFVLKPEQ
jgi:hypothetical protein